LRTRYHANKEIPVGRIEMTIFRRENPIMDFKTVLWWMYKKWLETGQELFSPKEFAEEFKERLSLAKSSPTHYASEKFRQMYKYGFLVKKRINRRVYYSLSSWGFKYLKTLEERYMRGEWSPIVEV